MSIVFASPRESTSVERAYRALRRMAIEFTLRPGERLNEVALARRLDMSRVPLREALNRLASEGLLDAVPNQGFRGRKLSVSEFTALYEVRGDLEAAAARTVAGNPDDGRLLDLERLAEATLRDFAAVPVDDLVERDEAFHLELAAIAGNAERVSLLRNINARIRFVRRINLEAPGRMRRSLEEHLEIVRALRAGDEDGAGSIVRRHLGVSAEEAAAAVERGLARIYSEQLA